MKLCEAAPVQGTVVVLTGARGAGQPGPTTEGGDGIVALVDGAPATALEPFAGRLAAILCLDEDPDPGVARTSRALGVPCVVGVSFDGEPPVDGSLVLVDCARTEEGVVLVVDGGAADVDPAAPGGVRDG